MRRTPLILGLLLASGCSSRPIVNDPVTEFGNLDGAITSVTADVSGVVVVLGGESHSNPDGSVAVSSPGGGRAVEVLCDPSPFRRMSAALVGLGGTFRDGLDEDFVGEAGNATSSGTPLMVRRISPEERQSGRRDHLRAASLVVVRNPDGSRVLRLQDVLLDGASAPIPAVTLACSACE